MIKSMALTVAMVALSACTGTIQGVEQIDNGVYKTVKSDRNASDKATMQCGRQLQTFDVLSKDGEDLTFICKP